MARQRNDIQGLRGLCMIIIFIYHYNKNFIPSGLIGVDIFFLISGYVNTLSKKESKNKNILDFYCKRIIRLFPVSLLGILYSIIVICNSMSPEFQNKQLNDILSCIICLSNYRFYYLSINYVLLSESQSIVLHYWSLSVEDQFYIFFPFLFLFYNKCIYLLLIFLSYAYSIYIYFNNYLFLYFSTLCRVWEFILGMILVDKNVRINEINITIFIIIFLFFKKELSIYVPISSIIPLILTSSLIINAESLNNNILSRKILVFLGNISYPFYIFHYIILYNFRFYSRENIINIFISSLFISYLIYHIVMLNINKIKINNISTIVLYFIFALTLSLTVYNKINKNIKNQKLNKNVKISYIDVKKEWSNFFRKICKCQNFFISRKKDNLILLLMDSHGEQWSNIYIPYAIELNYIVIQLYYFDYIICKKKYMKLNNFFSQYSSFAYIIVSHFLHCIYDRSVIFSQYIKYLLNYTNAIYVIQDTPHFAINPINCIYSQNNNSYCYGIIGINATLRRFPIVYDKRVNYIDMNKYICQNNICRFIINNMPVYKDDNHLTIQFASTLANIFLKNMKLNPIKNKNYSEKCNFEYRCYLNDINKY